MGSQAERDAGNGARPSISGPALRVETAQGTMVEVNDVWTARILVTTISWAGAYLAKGLVDFFHENPKLVTDTIQQALKGWCKVVNVTSGSIIVDLECGSQEKLLKFQKDFEDGKVKDAMEKEFREIGCDAKLELKLMKETPKMAMIEVR